MKITAVDLKEKRVARGLTQSQLAEMLGVYPQHVYKIEAGLRNVTTPLVASCVDIFGSLRIAKGDRVYRVTPDTPDDPPTRLRRVPSDGMTLGEKIVRVSKEGRELLAKAVLVNKYLVMLHRNPEAAAEFGGEITKELADVLAWGEDLMASLHEAFDAAYHEAEGKSAQELAAEMEVSA